MNPQDPSEPARRSRGDDTSSMYRLSLDSLGKYVRACAEKLDAGMSFYELCRQHRGPSCLSPEIPKLPHAAAGYLQRLRRHGAPVVQSTPPWTLEQLDAAVARGPHLSSRMHAEFLRNDMCEMVERGIWMVLPYRCVRHLRGLRVAPMGVVPQRNRRPRPIVDYTYNGVNGDTVLLAPDSMQFGHAFPRFLQRLHRADTRHGPVYLAKTDVSDGFYRVGLSVSSIPALGVVIPSLPGEEPLIAFPMALPMGWIESPPYFCAVTETITDITNDRLASGNLAQATHRFDDLADSPPDDLPPPPGNNSSAPSLPPPVIRSRGPLQRPLAYVDGFVDDWIQAVQGPPEYRRAVRRTLFEVLDAVIRPLAPDDNPHRKEPNSMKKLKLGDASWATRKIILGWLIDTLRRTIELPPHRVDRLHELLDSFPRHQRRTSRRKWQQVLGELRSMVLAIPGGRGLFSQLQSVLDYRPDAKPSDRLTLSSAVHDQLDDLRLLAEDLRLRPTRWGECVDTDPAFIGAVDAAAPGMGGVWFDCAKRLPPLLWRQRFPPPVESNVVSWENPRGKLTNSDLEQAGVIAHADVLAQHQDLRERTICSLSDNIASVSREARGSTSTDSPSAYLCRLASLHQRFFRYRQRLAHIPGILNVMADILSRRWDLSDSQILDLFNERFPQEQPWQLCRLRSGMNSSVINALWKRRCETASLLDVPPPLKDAGRSGPNSVNNISWTPTLPKMKIPSLGYKYSLKDFEMAGLRPAASLSDLEQWRTPSVLLHRRTPCWARRIPERHSSAKPTLA